MDAVELLPGPIYFVTKNGTVEGRTRPSCSHFPRHYRLASLVDQFLEKWDRRESNRCETFRLAPFGRERAATRMFDTRLNPQYCRSRSCSRQNTGPRSQQSCSLIPRFSSRPSRCARRSIPRKVGPRSQQSCSLIPRSAPHSRQSLRSLARFVTKSGTAESRTGARRSCSPRFARLRELRLPCSTLGSSIAVAHELFATASGTAESRTRVLRTPSAEDTTTPRSRTRIDASPEFKTIASVARRQGGAWLTPWAPRGRPRRARPDS